MKCRVKLCQEEATTLRVAERPGMGSVNLAVCSAHASAIDDGTARVTFDVGKDPPEAPERPSS